jgi:glycosyltransferase involved in cell wall biosynthesis
MRIAVTSVQVPFIRGGAEIMADQLTLALNQHGHAAELITMPFRFAPFAAVTQTMNSWGTEDFSRFDCGTIDRVICLKFPSYYVQHPNKVVWLMHQHRSVYELYNTYYGECDQTPGASDFRTEIVERDTKALESARAVFTISARVSQRMQTYNSVPSLPIHQPPANAELFHCGDQLDYIFFPSRLETLKRQELLIRAMARCRVPVAAIIAGDGGARTDLQQLIYELKIEDRVRLIGRIDDEAMRTWYANALGIFFGPYDEDYGFITLEAMLSSKPVITCTDSGGPLDFVLDGETGRVVTPDPDSVADAIEYLYEDKQRARDMGVAGLSRYRSLDISWDHVVQKLLA